jgi:hypothetical protein
MGYQATIFNLMISCPSDAEPGYEAIRKSINNWNDKNSEEYQIVLLPQYYKTHVPAVSAPPSDPRPQSVPNEYIVHGSDWLIAIFKDKIGTPTGRADSGTLEEIEYFISEYQYKPVSVYFYENTKDEKVLAFREKLRGRDFSKEYKDEDDLYKIFLDDLPLVLHRNNYLKERRVDYKRKNEDQADFLVIATSNDPNNVLLLSEIREHQNIVEINGSKFLGCENALEISYERGYFDKKDKNTFILNDFGKQRANALKFI